MQSKITLLHPPHFIDRTFGRETGEHIPLPSFTKPGPDCTLGTLHLSSSTLQLCSEQGPIMPALQRRLSLERLHLTQSHIAQKWLDSGVGLLDGRAVRFPATWRLALPAN